MSFTFSCLDEQSLIASLMHYFYNANMHMQVCLSIYTCCVKNCYPIEWTWKNCLNFLFYAIQEPDTLTDICIFRLICRSGNINHAWTKFWSILRSPRVWFLCYTKPWFIFCIICYLKLIKPSLLLITTFPWLCMHLVLGCCLLSHVIFPPCKLWSDCCKL